MAGKDDYFVLFDHRPQYRFGPAAALICSASLRAPGKPCFTYQMGGSNKPRHSRFRQPSGPFGSARHLDDLEVAGISSDLACSLSRRLSNGRQLSRRIVWNELPRTVQVAANVEKHHISCLALAGRDHKPVPVEAEHPSGDRIEPNLRGRWPSDIRRVACVDCRARFRLNSTAAHGSQREGNWQVLKPGSGEHRCAT